MAHQRILPISGGQNFRDLGGYPTSDGHHTKWGKIYRTGRLGHLTDDDLSVLSRRHIVADIDFRTTIEEKLLPDKLPTGAKYFSNQIFKPRTEKHRNSGMSEEEAAVYMEPGQGAFFMKRNYKMMIENPYCQSSFRKFFATVLDQAKNGAVLFHCTAGKDRTGLGAYLLLRALGVDEETATKDYLLTNPTIQPRLDQRMAAFRKKGATEEQVANALAMASVSPDYLGTAKATIRQLSGTVDHYLSDYLGLGPAERATLKQLLVE